MNRTMFRPHRALLVPILVMTAACSGPERRSVDALPAVEHATLDAATDAIIEESAKLFDQFDRLNAGLLSSKVEQTTPKPIKPRYDPLENEVATVNMQEATIGQLLWALANQLNMSLVVEPSVFNLSQRASLYLKSVSAREVFRQIMSTFDLHGEVVGQVLRVSPLQEKVFSLDLLSSTTTATLDTGGDVFGSAGGDSSLRGTLSMAGSIGEKEDPVEQLAKAVESILKEDEQQGAVSTIEKGRFSLDRSSGTMVVRARPSRVAAVEALVRQNKRVRQRQVQVDAQLIDVQLNDKFQFGVDWSLLSRNIAGRFGAGAMTVSPVSGNQPGLYLTPRNIAVPGETIGFNTETGGGIGFANGTFSATINALRGFGAVKVLSNPTVRVRNGMPAYLSVGSNIRYVTKLTTSFSNPGGGATNTSADVQTDSLFSGVVIGVAPFIQEDGGVELFVHPMQTNVEPGSLAMVDVGAGNRVTLPIVNTKGITTMLNMRDGDVVIIGGLIDQSQSQRNDGIPGLADVPGVGKLFDKTASSQSSRELIVILRVSVL
jgi:general secretion pathway protein D